MARQRRHSTRRRRRGRFSGLYRLLSILAVAAAIAVACVVFFRINEVTVAGNSRYTAEEVIEASGIETGDNLVTLPKGRVASQIRTRLPYVESVSIQRLLPDGVLLTVKERVAAAVVDSDEGRWLISAQGKLLEQAGGQQLLTITGLKVLAPYAGGTMQVAEEDGNTLDYVLALLTELESREMLADCTALDCTAAASMTLSYDIYQVKLPRRSDYSKLLALLQGALADERMPQGVPGTFDLTVKEGEAYFLPQPSQ